MRHRSTWVDGVFAILGLIFGAQARATEDAQRETRNALAALKMPTPKWKEPGKPDEPRKPEQPK